MPFTDPMADGPSIQAAGLRALKGGMTLKKTLEMVRGFRKDDNTTPLVLMGYYNPIYIYGVDKFLADAKTAGVDGLIIVDLPPEEDDELCIPALKAGLNFIRLATPTTDDKRLPAVLANTSGFVYYVSITGITGAPAPTRRSSGTPWRGSSATPNCQCVSASASAPRRRRGRLPRRPTAPWSVPRWSTRCATAWTRRGRRPPRRSRRWPISWPPWRRVSGGRSRRLNKPQLPANWTERGDLPGVIRAAI